MQTPTIERSYIKDFLASFTRKKLLINLDPVIEFERPKRDTLPVSLCLYASKVSAGFPSPAEEHVEKRLDTNDYLVDQKEATFFVTIQGQSMIDVGLLPGDKAVVDRSKTAKDGSIILAVVNGEFTIKTLSCSKNGNARLIPANSTGGYSPIEISEDMQFEVWGVVIGSFRRFE